MMASAMKSTVGELRAQLTSRYRERKDIARVLHDAGVDDSRINLDAAPATAWAEALRETRDQGKLAALLEVVRSEYPNVDWAPPASSSSTGHRATDGAALAPALSHELDPIQGNIAGPRGYERPAHSRTVLALSACIGLLTLYAVAEWIFNHGPLNRGVRTKLNCGSPEQCLKRGDQVLATGLSDEALGYYGAACEPLSAGLAEACIKASRLHKSRNKSEAERLRDKACNQSLDFPECAPPARR